MTNHAARVAEIRAWSGGEWSPGDPHIKPGAESFTRDLLAAYDALAVMYAGVMLGAEGDDG